MLVAIVIALGLGSYYGTLYGSEVEIARLDGSSHIPIDLSGEDQAAETIVVGDNHDNVIRQTLAQEASASFAYWTFWAIVLQTVVAAFALTALIRDLRQNKRSSEAQLRAYVSINPIQLNTFANNGKMYADIELTNGGATPAYKLFHAGNFMVGSEAEVEAELTRDDAPRERIGRPAPLTLQIGKTSKGNIYSTVSLTDQDVQDIEAQRKGLYLFGFVEYEDAFGHPRQTLFCYRCEGLSMQYDFMSSQEKIEKKIEWVVVPFHNYSS